MAPDRAHLPELLDDVLAGTLGPGRVFDLELPLADAAQAGATIVERRSIRTLLRPAAA